MAVDAKQLVQQGKVREAVQALGAWLRDHPTDVPARTFLFELLCFAGEYDRAEKQLGLLAEGNSQKEMGAILYYSALHAEKTRNDMFRRSDFSHSPAKQQISGTLNGKRFESITDADPNIGPRLEAYAAGSYIWVPFEHIESVQVEAPRRLRDTLWATASIRTGPAFKETDMGQALLPAIYPLSWMHPDESVWLGRLTEWVADESGREYPLGQKLLLVDDEEVPFLEIRSLEIEATQAAAQ